jgi:predicted nucleic acid-binding protein
VTSGTRAVLDASVFVRAAVDKSESARAWTETLGLGVSAHAPDLLWPEFTNSLRGLVAAAAISRRSAHQAIELTKRLPVHVHSTRDLAEKALDASLAHDLSAYDACYLVLADALDATLVTADRRLAEAAANGELLA